MPGGLGSAAGFALAAAAALGLQLRRQQQFNADAAIEIVPGLGPSDSAKLAPFLPTSQAGIDKALEFLEVGPGDTLLDLGCGDGRVICTAAERYGTKCIGVEYDGRFARRAAARVAALGLRHRVTVLHGDALAFDIRPFSIIFVFLTPTGISKIGDSLVEAYNRGVRIAAYTFRLRDLPVAAHAVVRDTCSVYLYDKSKPAVMRPALQPRLSAKDRVARRFRTAALKKVLGTLKQGHAKAVEERKKQGTKADES